MCGVEAAIKILEVARSVAKNQILPYGDRLRGYDFTYFFATHSANIRNDVQFLPRWRVIHPY